MDWEIVVDCVGPLILSYYSPRIWTIIKAHYYWALFAVLFGPPPVASLYFLVLRVFQHYRNPNIRAMYSYRLWVVKSDIASQLKKAGLIKRRRVTLPIELWEMILDEALDIPFLFDTSCDPSRFHLFIPFRFLRIQPLLYRRSESLRRRLRLVCHSWDTMLSRKGREWIHTGLGQYMAIPRRTKAISCSTFPRRITTSGRGSTSQAEVDKPLLSIIFIYFPDDAEMNQEEESTELFEGASNFTKVRSLGLSFVVYIPEQPIWSRIQRSFSALTVLTIECFFIAGVLQLDKVEILYLNGYFVDLEKWSFPSLRQVALGGNTTRNGYHPREHIPGPLNKLQSLLLYQYPRTLIANTTFWTNHPSLQFLGLPGNKLHVKDSPPAEHPLSYLYFTESGPSNTSPLDFLHAIHSTRRLPNLRSITIPVNRNSPEWRSLFRSLHKKGVACLDYAGEKINPDMKNACIPLRKWEHVLFFLDLINEADFFFSGWFNMGFLPDSWLLFRKIFRSIHGAWQISRKKIL